LAIAVAARVVAIPGSSRRSRRCPAATMLIEPGAGRHRPESPTSRPVAGGQF
jgi:hypothetical protein